MRDVLDSQKFISWKSLLALLHSDASRGVLLEYTQTLLCTRYLSLFEIDHTMPFAILFQLGELNSMVLFCLRSSQCCIEIRDRLIIHLFLHRLWKWERLWIWLGLISFRYFLEIWNISNKKVSQETVEVLEHLFLERCLVALFTILCHLVCRPLLSKQTITASVEPLEG